MDEKQFKIIREKLDKIIALLIIQNIQSKEDKIYTLKKLGFSSSEIAPIFGMAERGVRGNKGWKRE